MLISGVVFGMVYRQCLCERGWERPIWNQQTAYRGGISAGCARPRHARRDDLIRFYIHGQGDRILIILTMST